MVAKKAKKTRTSRSVRNLPARVISAKGANEIKGGFWAAEHGTQSNSGPKETLTFTFGTVGVKYMNQD